MSNQEITHKDESGAESFKFTQRGYMCLNPETLEWNYCNPAFSLRSLADIKRIVELEKEQRDAVDREQGLITALDNLQTLQKKCQSLESALITVRGILNSQSDKSCLGTGSTSTGDCAPWSIVDEVVHGITQALKEAK